MGGKSSKNQNEFAEKFPERANSLRQRQDDIRQKLDSVRSGQADSNVAGKDTDEHNLQQTQNTRPRTLNAEELLALTLDPKDYSYPFENLVLEGGGAKGIAYVGAIKVLEELKILPQIKRYAGTSIGSLIAGVLAVGYNSAEIKDIIYQDLIRLINDAPFGYLSLLPNVVRHYGWNPGKRLYEWYGKVLSKKTNDADITFSEVFRRYGIEICIVATNLNHMAEEYFHPKTTPDMPIRFAVRMSMSVPGLFQAVPYTENGETNTYIDGSVLCTYPIHCYDGWWLSMAEGDSFLERLQPLDDLPKLLSNFERFGGYNEKTLGLLVYSDSEDELFRSQLDSRVGATLPTLPNTSLAKKGLEKRQFQISVTQEHQRVSKAVKQFLKVLKKHDITNKGSISKDEMKTVFSDEDFNQEDAAIVFGKDANEEKAFSILDENKTGKIEYHQLIHFVESTGVFLTHRYNSYQRRDITNLGAYLDALNAALLNVTMQVYLENRDLTRTVGINTGHIKTTDFNLETADKDYIVQQGETGMISYLKYYAATRLVKQMNEVKLESEQNGHSRSEQREEFTITENDQRNSDHTGQPTGEPKEQDTNEPKEELTNEPKEGLTNEPREGLTNEPKEGLTNEPKEGLTNEPKEGLTNEPKEEAINEPKEGLIDEPKEELISEPKEVLTD